jgi:tetratricopeptide (TPR) repeat protein
MAKDLTGATFGKYQIVERLGRGGMADVYRAYQPGMDRYVAIKIMHAHLSEDPDFITRFKREAQSVGALRHPNIVQVIDFDSQDDEYYMVMEYIKGDTLKTLLKQRGALPLDEALDLLIKLADAVAYAHSQGMIHRDIKPANVLMSGPHNPVLTDFGIARILTATGLTASGLAIGTPAYISPEAGRGEKVDERADIYSLGIVLYEMLTGVVPYDADTPYAVILKHINDPLPGPRQRIPDLPESVEQIILKALAKNRNDRFQSAAEFRDALQEAKDSLPAEAPTRAGKGTAVPAVNKARITSQPTIVGTENPPERGVRLAVIGAVVVIILIAGALVLLSNRQGQTPEPTGLAAAPTATLGSAVTAQPTATQPATAPTITTQAPGAGTPQTTGAAADRYASLIQRVKQLIIESDFDQAVLLVEEVLKTDPQSYDLLVLAGRTYIEYRPEDRDKAKASADAAVKIDPNRPEAYIVLGQYYQFSNTEKSDEVVANLKQAVSYYNQALDKGTTDYYAYWLRARAHATYNGYVGQEDRVPLEQIVADYDKAVSLSPQDFRFFVERGDFYSELRDYQPAQASYERALALHPGDMDIVTRLAGAYLLLDQKQKAYDLYANSIQASQSPDPHHLADAAYLAWVNGKPEQATEWAKRALALDANTPAATYLLALLASDAKDYEGALARLDEVAKVTDTWTYAYPFLNSRFNHTLYVDRARILTAMGRIDDAIKAYGDEIQINDAWSRPYVERGQLYLQQGKRVEADQDLRKALDLALSDKDTKTADEAQALLDRLGPVPPPPEEPATP